VIEIGDTMTLEKFKLDVDGLINDFINGASDDKEFRDGIFELLVEVAKSKLTEKKSPANAEAVIINYLAGKSEGLGERPALKDYSLMRSIDIINIAHNMFTHLHWGDKNGITPDERNELLEITKRIAARLYTELSWYKDS